MLATPTTTPTTGPRVLSVTVSESPLLTSTTGASILSEGTGLESAVVSSIATPTQTEVGKTDESASATGAGAFSAPATGIGTEAPSFASAGSLATTESGVGTEQTTASATTTPAVLNELLTVALAPTLTATGQGATGEAALTGETAFLTGAVSQDVVGQAIAEGSATLPGVGSLTSAEIGAAAESGTATGVSQGTTATTTRARESATARGTTTLSLLNLLLRVSPKVTLTTSGSGNVNETSVTGEAASLVGVGAGSISEFGLAQVRPATSAVGVPSLSSAGIAAEAASPSAQGSLFATEVGALLPALTLAGQGALTATEAGRTAVTSSLAGASLPSIKDAGVQGVSALLSLAAATSTTDRAVVGERVGTAAKGAFALGDTSLAVEAPAVPALTQLVTQEAAVGQESATASGNASFAIFEVGAGVAVLSPVTVEGVSALDVIESSRTGEAATLTGKGAGTVKGRGITGDSALLAVGSDTATTETGLVLAAPSVRAAATLATLDPSLRADEAAAILAAAQAAVLDNVPARIAEIRAVLRDRITADARLRDSLLIDALLQD